MTSCPAQQGSVFYIKGYSTVRLKAATNGWALRALLRRRLYLYFFQISTPWNIRDQVSHFIEYIGLFCQVWSPRCLSSNALIPSVSSFSKERMPTTTHRVTPSPPCSVWGTNTWLRGRSSCKPGLVFSSSVTMRTTTRPFKERV